MEFKKLREKINNYLIEETAWSHKRGRSTKGKREWVGFREIQNKMRNKRDTKKVVERLLRENEIYEPKPSRFASLRWKKPKKF